MDYDPWSFDVSKWSNYLAYKVLMYVPKFSNANAAGREDVETETEEEEEEEVEILESACSFNSDDASAKQQQRRMQQPNGHQQHSNK
jgi:hypothetical protein